MGKPNIVLIQADQLAPQFLPAYGHPLIETPAISQLADEGVLFERAYSNSPLCAPSRCSMMAGVLPSRIGGYDNGAEFPASVPTLAHYLRLQGYRTCLSGKMHFIGPDQLHGFEERVTTDIYNADFNFSVVWPDNQEEGRRRDVQLSWGGNTPAVQAAGTAERTLQLDFDEECRLSGGPKRYTTTRALAMRDRSSWSPRSPILTILSSLRRSSGIGIATRTSTCRRSAPSRRVCGIP